MRVLIGSAVRQQPPILTAFLAGLAHLDCTGMDVEFAFIDDNDDPTASDLLRTFAPGAPVAVLPGEGKAEPYYRDGSTHCWTESLIWRVARYKDTLIERALAGGHDALFLVDSDLVLHPLTLRQLVATGKDIVAEIFWTRWTPDAPELPQVWLFDQYSLHPLRRGQPITDAEKERLQAAFLAQLREPGVYRVGGLGACTLVRRRPLAAGLRFAEIPNLSLTGEDRHFSVRAAALGFELYVDTHLPALHLYRPSDLARVPEYMGAWDRMTSQWHLLVRVRAGLEAWGTTDYRDITGHEAQAYFTAELREHWERHRHQAVTEAQATGLISRTQTGGARILHLDEEAGEALVQVAVVNEGQQAGVHFRDCFRATVLARRVAGEWQLASVEFVPAAEEGQNKGQGEGARAGVQVVTTRQQPKLTLSMVVRNEANRYLRDVLAHARAYVDEFVILDDASEDDTVAVCREVLAGCRLHLFCNQESLFHNEVLLRRRQWELTVNTEPQWILFLDADEMFEDKAQAEIRSLLYQNEFDVVCFRLYDFWDLYRYREDRLWQAHRTWRPLLIRYRPGFPYRWRETSQHCGRVPANVVEWPALYSHLRIKHFGWANPRDRLTKYERYMRLDPRGEYGSLEQYRSILDPAPRLVHWQE